MSRSEEESVLVGEAVSRVLKEADPERIRFLTSPTLKVTGCNPSGHPSSCSEIMEQINHLGSSQIPIESPMNHHYRERERERNKTSGLPVQPYPYLIKYQGEMGLIDDNVKY